MDQHLKSIIEHKIRKTLENLDRNHIMAIYLESKDQVVAKLTELLRQGDTVACGGSMTLFETGVIEHLRSGRYHFLDRYAEGLTRDQLQDIFRKSFLADGYVTSTNAITENGELYNVDGNGNRVAAMMYGPENVIVVAGINKLVRDVDEAVQRVKTIAAPANATRLSTLTPCVKTGTCMACKSEQRICCSYTVFGQQRVKNRMKVILVGEPLGY